jgi:hypothetical protein
MHGPQEHFRLHYYGAVLLLRERLLVLAPDHVTVLAPYLDEFGGPPLAHDEWDRRLTAWEDEARAADVRLPLCDLADAADLDRLALGLLLVCGLVEEDPRFGPLFELLHGLPDRQRPTVGLLTGWWTHAQERARAHRSLTALAAADVVELATDDGPRSTWAVQAQPLLWSAVRGDVGPSPVPWAICHPPEAAAELDTLILPEPLRDRAAAVTGLLHTGTAGCVVVRGRPGSGRRTVLAAVARTLGCGVLDLSALTDPADARWRIVGPLATLTHTLPLLTPDPGPGQTAHLPRLTGYAGPLALRLPVHGGAAGPAMEAAVTLTLGVPDAPARLRHWAAVLNGYGSPDVRALAEHSRMTGGTIRRVARLAVAEAAASGRDTVTAADAQRAGRTVGAELLDTLAARVDARGTWDDLAVGAETRAELLLLERRCRNRERLPRALPRAVGDTFGPGVRAVFTGPSGTGKTLAARLLAAALGKDLYRLDLSSVVNKYLGETEKNLDRVLGLAEDLDVVLLLDEGDALLTQRTDVQTANDRYANLETNFLLQRLETFEGILIVTTNAAQRIDPAFERRMDVAVDFPAPGPAERWAIWGLHLPDEHNVDDAFRQEVAARCALTGGQIRGALLHATLLALGDDRSLHAHHLDAAIRREYRKLGAVCPLRPRAASRA